MKHHDGIFAHHITRSHLCWYLCIRSASRCSWHWEVTPTTTPGLHVLILRLKVSRLRQPTDSWRTTCSSRCFLRLIIASTRWRGRDVHASPSGARSHDASRLPTFSQRSALPFQPSPPLYLLDRGPGVRGDVGVWRENGGSARWRAGRRHTRRCSRADKR